MQRGDTITLNGGKIRVELRQNLKGALLTFIFQCS